MALNFPDTPTNGEKYIAANGVEYTYNSDKDSWTGALEAGVTPINPSPDNVTAVPDFGNPAGTNPGAGTTSDPYILTTETVLLAGGSITSDQYITVVAGKPGDQVLFTNGTTPTDIAPKFNQVVGTVDANGKWSGYITYTDVLGVATVADSTYVGKLQLGTSSVYFQWTVNQGAATPLVVVTPSADTAVTQPTISPSGNSIIASQPVMSGGISPYTYAYQWEESADDTTYTSLGSGYITNNISLDNLLTAGNYYRCKVTVTDSGSFGTLTTESITGGVNVVSATATVSNQSPKEGDSVTTEIIVEGNKTGYVKSNYQWYRTKDSVTTEIPGATFGIYTIPATDVGYTLSCKVTASSADVDQSNVSATSPETAAVEPVQQAPIIGSVVLTEIENGSRYTDKQFPYVVDMAIDGTPGPTYAVKAKLTGATFDFGVRSDTITAVTSTAGTQTYKTDTIANVVSESQWNQSKTWSNEITSPDGTISSTYDSSNAFSGNLTTRCQTTEAGKTIRWTPAGGIVLTSSFRVYTGAFSGEISARVSGVDYVLNANANNVPASGYVDSTVTTGNLEYIDVQGQIGAGDGYVTGYAVNGKLMVNDGIPNPPIDNTLTFPTSNNFDKFEVGDVVQDPNRWNQAQVWSNGLSTTGGSVENPTQAFNGDTTNAANGTIQQSPTASTLTFTLPAGLTFDGKVEAWLGQGGSPTYKIITDKGDYPLTLTGGGTLTKYDISAAFNLGTSTYFTVSVLNVNQTAANLAGVVINGLTLVDTGVPNPSAVSITAIDTSAKKMIMDGGSWKGADGTIVAADGRYEPSQEWSNVLTSSNGFPSGYGPTNAFNGVVGDPQSASNNSGTLTFAPNLTIPANSIIEGWFGSQSTSNTDMDVVVNGVTNSNVSGNSFQTLTYDNSTTLTSITITRSDGTNSADLRGLKINGSLLVDSSVPGAQVETTVDKNIAYANQLTVAGDSKLSQITGGVYMTDGSTKTDGSGEYAPADYTLETSTIASVVPLVYGTTTSGPTNSSGTYSWEHAFNGSFITPGANGQGAVGSQDYYMCDVSNLNIKAGDVVKFLCNNTAGTPAITYGTWNVNSNYVQPDSFVIDSSYGGEHGATATWTATGPVTGFGVLASPQVVGIVINGLVINNDTIKLTFNSPNPDLQYFQPGDKVGGVDSGFKPVIYTGNGAQVCGFSPDLVWIKCRNVSQSHALFDSISGPLMQLESDTTDSQQSIAQTLLSFDSDGFTVGNNGGVGKPDRDYVAWCWDAGDTTVTNNAGSIPSQVRSNGNFSVLTYTGTESATNVGHGLSSTPALVIAKTTGTNGGWIVWHKSLADGSTFLYLDMADSASSSSANFAQLPDATKLYLGGSPTTNSVSGNVAYAWAETPGVSSFGSYTGSVGNKITTAFRPAFVMVKRTTGNDNWGIAWDLNEGNQLAPNSEAAELTNCPLRFQDDGFSFTNDAAIWNDPNDSYIYAAFANGYDIDVVSTDVAANTMTVDNEGLSVGQTAIGPTVTGTGTIVDKTTSSPWKVSLNPVGGRWIGPNKAGTNFEFAPVIPVVDQRTEVYCAMQIIDDKAEVMGIQTTDPGFLNTTSKNYIIEFPSLFTDGDAPDAALPLGTAITATVKATNVAGDYVKESNTLLPAAVNPADSAGPITAVLGAGIETFSTDTIASTSAIVETIAYFADLLDLSTVKQQNPWRMFDNTDDDGGWQEYGTVGVTGFPRVSSSVSIEVNLSGNTSLTLVTSDGTYNLTVPANTWSTATFNCTGTIQSITNTNTGANDGRVQIRRFFIDGVILQDGNSYNFGYELTFPTANNFDKFEVGDVVQSDYIAASVIEEPANPVNNGAGWGDGNPDTASIQRTSGRWIAKPNLTVDGTQVQVKASLSASGTPTTGSFNVIVNEGLSSEASTVMTSANIAANDATNFNTGTITLSSAASIETIAVYPSTAPGNSSGNMVSVAVIYIDGVELYEPGFSGNDYAITAIDAAGPTMTTNGGEWLGANGSGPAGGATVLTTTESYNTKLTLGNATNLNTFVDNDALKMVDTTGAVTSYTPVTNTITSVAIETTAATTTGFTNNPVVALYDGSGGGGSTQSDLSGSVTVSLNLTNSSVELTSDSIMFGASNGSSSSYNNFTVVFSFSDSSSITDSSKQLGPGDQLTSVLNGAVGKTLTGISWSSSNLASALISISGLTINGSYFNAADYSNTLLTFTGTAAANNKDLKFFNPGDVLGTPTGFKPVIYTGNGGTQSINCGFSPDLVWVKARTTAGVMQHVLMDSVRGNNEMLCSNSTGAATDFGSPPDWGYVSSFDSDGFTIASGGNGIDQVGQSGSNYVAWCWDAGNTTVTNNDGSIQSQVRSNGNFSVVSYVGNQTAGAQVGHGLSSPAKFIIVKQTNATRGWPVYTEAVGPGGYLSLDSTGTANIDTIWGNVAPTSSYFTIGNQSEVNESAGNYIAYCWAETAGVSSFGEYTGNGLATQDGGKVIDVGFSPGFVMVKRTDDIGDWMIFDAARNDDSPSGKTPYLIPNLSNVEDEVGAQCTFSSTGFTLGSLNNVNASGGTYIYAAFAGTGSEGTVVSTDVAANTMNVNGGDYALWNQSQVWSTVGTITGSAYNNDQTFVKTFNGVTAGNTNNAAFASSGGTYTYTFNPAITTDAVTLIGSANGGSLLINSGQTGERGASLEAFAPGVTTGAVEFSLSNGVLYNINLTNNGESGTYLYGIEVDGKLLVDTGVLGVPPTVATGPKKSGTGTFVSTNGTNSMSITNSNLDWISNDNRLSKDFYVQPLVTKLNKDNPAHVALQQAIVTAFSTVKTNASPALTGDLYRLLAGETLTTAEIATLTDRLTAATHGDRPFHLDGYYPLYYTAVGANAASPAGTSHTHVLGGNTYYMPNGVTIYHGTYVPTVETYTVNPNITTNPTTNTSSSSSSSSSSSGGGGGGGGGY